MGKWILRCFLLSFSQLGAMLVGDPAQPALQTCGVLFKKPCWFSFRAGYIDDWVYQQHFQDESILTETNQTTLKLSTYAAQLTANFVNRLDLYGIVGSSRMQIDYEIFTKRALAWGIGGKLIVLREGNFFLGTDFKYFQTDQKPRYFVVEGLPYNIVNNYRLHYYEVQAAVGMAYQISLFVPYINATYLIAKMEPVPSVALVRLPDTDERADVFTKRISSLERWGLSLGFTLMDSKRFAFSVEWRAINQNAIDWNFEFRF